jgi:hypothetical protein
MSEPKTILLSGGVMVTCCEATHNVDIPANGLLQWVCPTCGDGALVIMTAYMTEKSGSAPTTFQTVNVDFAVAKALAGVA